MKSILRLGKINPNVKIFLISDAFYYTSYDAVNTFLALLVTLKIAPDRIDLAGLVIGYYMLLRAVIEIPLSRLMVAYKLKTKLHILMTSHILYGIIIALLGFATTQLHVFTIMTLLAILDAVLFPIKWTLFSKIIDKDNEETEWGLEDTLSATSTSIFVILGGLLAQQYGVQVLFFIMGGLFVTSGLLYRRMHFKKHMLELG